MLNLNKIIKSKTGVVLGALLMCFSISVFVMAWTDPSTGPPDGNVPAPMSSEGGIMTGLLNIEAGVGDALSIKDGGDLRIYNSDNSGSALLFVDTDGELITQGKFKVDGDLAVIGGITRNSNTVWDAGNDGSGTGLDADTVDGYEAADLMAAGGAVDDSVHKVRMTTNIYGGNLGGYAGANAKCDAEYPGSRFCSRDELDTNSYIYEKAGQTYRYDYTNIQFDTHGWMALGIQLFESGYNVSADCFQWSSADIASYGSYFTLTRSNIFNREFYYAGMNYQCCSVIQPLWCCE